MQVQGTPFALVHSGSMSSPPNTFGLESEDSGLPLTAPTNTAYLDPFAIGGRFVIMASMFQKYRIRSGRIRWVPAMNYTDDLANGEKATSMVFGWHPDLVQVPSTFADGVRFGGRAFTVSKAASCAIGRTGWLYTTAPSASPSATDLRFTCFGGMYCFADGTEIYGTVDAFLGYFIFDLDVEFQGAQDGSILGSTTAIDQYKASYSLRSNYKAPSFTSFKQSRSSSDEKKDDDSPVDLGVPSLECQSPQCGGRNVLATQTGTLIGARLSVARKGRVD